MDSLELLKAYFKGEKFEFNGSIKEEIQKQNTQSLAPFLYFVYGDKFLNVYLGATMLQERFYRLQDEITKLFNENKIKHFFMKGSVLSRLYPDSALRTRGDIDLVVQESDFLRAKDILSNNGYHYEDQCDHHAGFSKNNLEVELHRRMIGRSDRFYSYFLDGFDHVRVKNEYEYELDPSFHFMFLLAHLNKHLRNGEGLRYILDFYYLNKAYTLDYDYIETELKKIGLYKLYVTICNACYAITGEKLPGYDGGNVDSLLSYMLNNGIHGKEGIDTLYEKNIIMMGNKKMKFLLSRVFLDKPTREAMYPKMSKCFLLYPCIIIHRFFYLLFKRNKSLKKVLKTDMKKSSIDENFFNEFGILD